MLKVFMTGGIGCGKTAVSDYFAKLGAPVIDTDILSRQLVAPGQPALSAIAERFGPDIIAPDGSLNRHKLRSVIFSDNTAKKDLEHILHPRIYAEVDRLLATLHSTYAIIVVPLLIETQQQELADRVLVIDSPDEIRKQRVLSRDNISAEQFTAILASQTGQQERLQYADDVICNDSDLHSLYRQVKQMHERYLQLADKYPV